MSVPRWDYRWSPAHDLGMGRAEAGEWVRYDDHVAALAEARLNGFDDGCRATEANYMKGRADAIRECVAAVVALSDGGLIDGEPIIGKLDALDALRALLPEGRDDIPTPAAGHGYNFPPIVEGEHVDWCRDYSCFGCVEDQA